MYKFVFLFTFIFFSVYSTDQAHLLIKERTGTINKNVTSWKMKQNFHPNTPRKQIIRLLGSIKPKFTDIRPIKKTDVRYVKNNEIPNTFDARIKWPYCKTIGEIRNQGNCGSCWAHSTTAAFADRLCIKTKGQFNKSISVEELAFCCDLCGFGCDGGDPYSAWEYFIVHGVVTGGNYNTHDGCQPYKIPPCNYDITKPDSCIYQFDVTIPECSKTCYGDKTINFKSDHHRTTSAYILSIENIQKDIITYGPIETTFEVYDDFINYGSGVYRRTANTNYMGLHSVKIIGWGEENHLPYWLLVNSWGLEFGDKGTFKILRGTNECDVESQPTAGIP